MGDHYSAEVTKRAVSRAIAALEFKNCEAAAIDALSDIVQNYIETIAASAKNQAELAGRCSIGINDVLPALEFTRPKFTSWKHLRDFAFEENSVASGRSEVKWCQPFPFEIPFFPVDSHSEYLPSSKSAPATHGLVSMEHSHIPSHLPPLPPAHTYKRISSSRKRSFTGSSAKHRTIDVGSIEAGVDIESRKIHRSSKVASAQQSLSVIEDTVDSTAAELVGRQS